MGMFDFNKKKKSSRPYKKRQLPSMDDILNRTIAKKAQADPEWGLAMAMQKFGLQPPEGADPVEAAKSDALAKLFRTDPEMQESLKGDYLNNMMPPIDTEMELHSLADSAILEQAKTNPDIMRKLIEKRMDELFGKDKKTSMSQNVNDLIETMKAIEELKGLGGDNSDKKGFLGGLSEALSDPDVIKSVLPLIMGMMNKGQVPQMAQPGGVRQVYVIETPQGLVETDATGYQQYLEEKNRTLIGTTPSNHPKPQVGPVITAQTPHSQPEIVVEDSNQEQEHELSINNILQYLEMEPLEFVSVLGKSLESGDPNPGILRNLLISNTPESFIAMLEPMAADRKDIKNLVDHLKDKKDWLGETISMLKEEANNQKQEL